MEITTREHLVQLMNHLGLPLIAAEVGTAEGIFSLDLLNQGMEKLYLIDIWERVPFLPGCGSFPQEWHDKNYEDAVERVKEHSNKVIFLKGFSYKMADLIPDESLGLVYVDACHDYYGVKADNEYYWPKLVKGGIMCWHDFGNLDYGVNKAVQEFTKNENIFYLPEDGNIVNMGAYAIKK